MRRREPRPVSEALQGLRAHLAPPTVLAEVQAVWASAAGAAFAASARPVSEREGVLTVACESSVWAQELELMSERVLAALNAELGRPAIRRIRASARRF